MTNNQRIKELKSELKKLLAEDRSEMRSAELRKHRKNIQFHKFCISYLDTNPDYDYMIKEIVRIKKRIKLMKDGFPEWVQPQGKVFLTEKRKEIFYLKECGVPHLKSQLACLDFLTK